MIDKQPTQEQKTLTKEEQAQWDRVRLRIAESLLEFMLDNERGSTERCTAEILSIKGLRVEHPDQTPPENPFAEGADKGDMHAQSRCSGYYCSQDDMVKVGWVRVLPQVNSEQEGE